LKRYNYGKPKTTTIHEPLKMVPVMGANPSTLGNLNPQERDEEAVDCPAHVTLPRECIHLGNHSDYSPVLPPIFSPYRGIFQNQNP
jgi:hypothetical protein